MKEGVVTVLALVKAKEGMEETVRGVLMSLIDPTRKEAGCVNYDLHQSTDDKSLFMFYENWKSMEDLEKHRETPHLKAFRQKINDLVAEPPKVTLFTMISEE